MPHLRTLNEQDLMVTLQEARRTEATASVRTEGSIRMLGDLSVCGLESGKAIYLQGAKVRDVLPPPGTAVTLTLLLASEVYSIRSVLLELPSEDATIPTLKVAWPAVPIEVHSRESIRVGTPDLPPLRARLVAGGATCEALLLNLTESGMGLGLNEVLPLKPLDGVVVETELPGKVTFRAAGQVRHVEVLHEGGLAMRVGLTLTDIPQGLREPLRRFLQARRTDRSDALRRGV